MLNTVVKNLNQCLHIPAATSLFAQYSCKKPKPGTGQAVASNTVLIYQPCDNVNIPNTFTDVNFRTKIKCITTDANQNPVVYQGSPIIDNPVRDQNGTILYGKEYTLYQPSGATTIVLEVEIETRECGWPVPGQNWSSGEMGWDYITPIHQFPVQITVHEHLFTLMFADEC